MLMCLLVASHSAANTPLKAGAKLDEANRTTASAKSKVANISPLY